jgi:hypothetical protein
MPQGNKSSNMDEPKQQAAKPAEAGREEGSVVGKSAEARIWAAATKLGRDDKWQFPEIQE